MSNNSNPYSKQIIKAWFDRSKSSNDSYTSFDRFISLWVSFNCFFVSEFYDEAKKLRRGKEPFESDYLRVIFQKEAYKKVYSNLLRNDSFKNKIEKFFNYLNGEDFITHFKGKVADMRPNRLTENEAQPFEDINNFEQFIRVIYQIRCNLFHGNKSPDHDGDVELVESIFDAFVIFIENMYEMKFSA